MRDDNNQARDTKKKSNRGQRKYMAIYTLS